MKERDDSKPLAGFVQLDDATVLLRCPPNKAKPSANFDNGLALWVIRIAKSIEDQSKRQSITIPVGRILRETDDKIYAEDSKSQKFEVAK